ncbi:flagellar basal body P-ring formation chaperone FlgA [Sedimenticola selenatireducens]|jgi:flagella basal body P-ring formation protein FlgA|nr:flagellar basal body P-ring formation chaperone FlgA [Sedimenticola selenatireducens]
MTATALASEYQSHDSIQDAAKDHVMDTLDDDATGVTVTPGRLDSRLRLAQCNQALDTFTPYGRKNSYRVTVGVRCNGSTSWTLFVPVTLTDERMVIVANRQLPRGTLVTADDIKIERRDVARLHKGYLTHANQVLGKKIKRSVQNSTVLNPSQLTVQHAVKKGSQVTILAQIGSLQVRMSGKALGNGAIGERIKVENSSSSRQIEATIVSPGIVQAST